MNAHPATFGVSLGGGNLTGGATLPEVEYRVIRDYVTPGLGVRHLAYQQQHNGQDMYGCLLTANVTTDGMLVNIGSTFLPEPAVPITPPTCGATNAVAAACDAVDDARIADVCDLIEVDCQDWKQGHGYDGVGATGLFVKTVLHPVMADQLVQAWLVRLPDNPASDGAAWECLVRASDLAILDSRDLTMRCTDPEPVNYFVLADDSPVPGTPGLVRRAQDEPNAPFDSECVMRSQLNLPACPIALGDRRVWRTVSSTDIVTFSPNGWINEGASGGGPNPPQGYTHCAAHHAGALVQTCGNNVLSISNGQFETPVLGDSQTRSLIGGTALSPEDRIVNAFVVGNEWHDRMHALGFDEVAGNFQAYNFGRGGVEGDPIRIHVSAEGNNYGSGSVLSGEPEDGGRFVVSLNNGPSRASGIDSTVVLHELTHALIARLHVGPVQNSYHGRALHEGWGDYYAIALTTKPADDFSRSFPVFSWAAREAGDPSASNRLEHYYFGVRHYPYTTNMENYQNAGVFGPATNPVTYLHADPVKVGVPLAFRAVYPASDAVAPYNPEHPDRTSGRNHYHGGFVWASILMDCREKLAMDMSSAAANDLMLQLLTDGMKLNPGNPNFVTARNSILQADLLRFGGVHHRRLWEGFARRGLGWTAGPPTNSATGGGILPSIAEPPPTAVSIFFPDGVPYTIATCGGTEIDVIVVAPAGNLTAVRGNAAPNPCVLGLPALLESTSPGHYRLVTRAAPCQQAWTLTVEADLSTSPVTTVISPGHAVYGGEESVIIEHTFEAVGPGWSETPVLPPDPENPLTPGRGEFECVDPAGSYFQPAFDTTPGTGLKCWLTQNRRNYNTAQSVDDVDRSGEGVRVESPALSVPSGKTILIELSLWYYSAGGATNDVEVHIDWLRGATRVPLAELTPANSASHWQRRRYTVQTGDAHTFESRLRVRFIDPGADSTVEGALDDVRIAVIVDCENCCDGDVNIDGNVDQGDVEYLIDVIGGGLNPSCIDPDFDRDGNADQADVEALINLVAGAGCP